MFVQLFTRKYVWFVALAGVAGLALVHIGQAEEKASVWPKMSQDLPDYEKRIDEVMAKMDIRDKVGQVVMGEIKSLTPRDVAKYRLGGILNGGGSWPNNRRNSSAGDWVKLSQKFHDASIEGKASDPRIPVLWGTDAVHGHNNVVGATLFPHNIGLGAGNNPDLMRKMGEAVALEMAATGIFWTFAPTITVPQNDRWGRTYEGYSEDPGIVSPLGVAMIEGLQGQLKSSSKFIASDKVAATAKHYLGDGGTLDGVDRGDTRINERGLREIHGESYIHALQKNVLTVMASFNSWNGSKLHADPYLLTEVLKNRMGFKGFVVGDWNGHGLVPGCDEGSCAKSINAGVDMIMVPEKWKPFFENTLKDAKKGRIPPERLDDAVRRILRVKFILGLFDGATPSNRAGAGDQSVIGSKAHRALARQAVRESLVLLKNNDNTLPLKASAKVLVVGKAAHDISMQSGGWSVTWQGNEVSDDDFPGATTMLAGIRNAVKSAGGSVSYSSGGSYKNKPDVAVVFFGENPYAEMLGDIRTLELPRGKQKRRLALMDKLRKDGVPVVAVYIGGRPLWLTQEINASDAFVAAWLPGTEGAGLSDVLFCDTTGKTSQCDFKGRLSFSWPRHSRDYNQNTGQPGYKPLFAVGYGLSYGKKHKNLASLEIEKALEAEDILGTILFQGQGVNPYKLRLQSGDSNEFFVKPFTTTRDRVVQARVFDYRVQEDAQKVIFSGKNSGLWQLSNTEEFTDWSEQDNAAMVIRMQVLKADKSPILYSLLCGKGCHATFDITEMLKKEKGEDWFDLVVPVACMKKTGANLATVVSPVVLHTKGKWTLNISNITFDVPPRNAREVECG